MPYSDWHRFFNWESDKTLPSFPQTGFSATFTAIPSFGKRIVTRRFIAGT